jgi:SsrA-binding protein
MARQPDTSKPDYSLSRVVCRNRKAKHDYELLEQLECGIALRGSEVKSIRNNKIAIEEAYVRVENGEIWLIGADIAEYPQATYLNHDPKRQRKLLMRRREMDKFARAAEQKGLTLVPLDIHLSRGFVKVTVAIARGQKEYDKREKIKKQADQREIRQAVRRTDR